MSDLLTQLRDYGDQLDEMAVPLSELTAQVSLGGALGPSRASKRLRSGWVVAFAAVSVLVLVGGVALLGGNVAEDVVDQSVVSSPTNPTVETSTPSQPPMSSGTWTVFDMPAGFAASRLLLAVDGSGHVFAVSQETGDVIAFSDVDNTWEGSSAPNDQRGRWVFWAIGLPGGGVAYGYGSEFDENDQPLDLGGIIVFQDGTWSVPTLSDGESLELNGASAAKAASDGSVWVVDYGDDQRDVPARFLRLAEGAWAEVPAPEAIVNAGFWNAGSRFSVGQDGALWSVVRQGAARYLNGETELFDFGRGGEACCLAWVQAAPNGDVWVHADFGVDRYRGGDWTHFVGEGLGHPDEYAIPTGDGSLWVQEGGIVSHFDGESWTNYTFEEASALAIPFTRSSAQLVQYAAAPNETTWVLTREGALHLHDGASWLLVAPPADTQLSAISLVLNHDGSVWVASEDWRVARYQTKP